MSWKEKFEEYIKAEQTLETPERIIYTKAFVIKPIAFWGPGMHFSRIVVNKKMAPGNSVAFVNEHILDIEFPEKEEDSKE